MSTEVTLRDVSLKFRIYQDKGATIKETIINKLLKRDIGKINEFWALKDINIKINNGEKVGIIGNNGAGKSTLLKLIARIYEPTNGMVKTKGKIAPLIELGAGFNQELSGYENIILNGAVMGFNRKLMLPLISPIVEFAELQEFIHMPVKYYSTGMYMRLAFSIATAVSPEILIIDELFAGGDINFVKKATNRMYDLLDNSKIVIMVSHSLDLIKRTCNRVILIDKGIVKADGLPNEVINYYIKINSN